MRIQTKSVGIITPGETGREKSLWKGLEEGTGGLEEESEKQHWTP